MEEQPKQKTEQKPVKWLDKNWSWAKKKNQRITLEKGVTIDCISYIRKISKILPPILDKHTRKSVSHYNTMIELYKQHGMEEVSNYITMINEVFLRDTGDGKIHLADKPLSEDEKECAFCNRITGPAHHAGCDKDRDFRCAWYVPPKPVPDGK